MSLIKKLGFIAGLGLGIVSYANAQSDSTIIEYTDTINDTIVEKNTFLFDGKDKFYLVHKESSIYNQGGRILLEDEREYGFKEKNLPKPSGMKKIMERKQVDKLAESFKTRRYVYDGLERLSKVEKNKNTQIGKIEKPIKSMEYYFYIGEGELPVNKLEDNDNNGKFNEGDKMYFRKPETNEWIELEPKKIKE